jgi:hypothetical protein
VTHVFLKFTFLGPDQPGDAPSHQCTETVLDGGSPGTQKESVLRALAVEDGGGIKRPGPYDSDRDSGRSSLRG